MRSHRPLTRSGRAASTPWQLKEAGPKIRSQSEQTSGRFQACELLHAPREDRLWILLSIRLVIQSSGCWQRATVPDRFGPSAAAYAAYQAGSPKLAAMA